MAEYKQHLHTKYVNADSSADDLPELYAEREDCCGCSSCYSICPVSAISMEPDEEGFLYPVIDAENCIRCNKCLSVCAFKHGICPSEENTLVFAARIKKREVLKKSSSGGMFTALSDYFLECHYPVVCSIYNYENNNVEFRIVDTYEERDAALGSKYIQSIPRDAFKKSVSWLKDHPTGQLLFVGTGCQAEGFRNLAESEGVVERVTVVDIICHGSPSPLIWKDYISSICEGPGENLQFITFKDKRDGWMKPTAVAKVGDKEVSLKKYMDIFYSGCVLRPSCHKCPYATIKRNTDMTIGDYWHIEEKLPHWYDPMGNSLVLIHTDKGRALFEAISDKLDVCSSDVTRCSQMNLEHPTPASVLRNDFWRDYFRYGIRHVVQKYGSTTMADRFLRNVKRILVLMRR